MNPTPFTQYILKIRVVRYRKGRKNALVFNLAEFVSNKI